jgi:hypothetical protein
MTSSSRERIRQGVSDKRDIPLGGAAGQDQTNAVYGLPVTLGQAAGRSEPDYRCSGVWCG